MDPLYRILLLGPATSRLLRQILVALRYSKCLTSLFQDTATYGFQAKTQAGIFLYFLRFGFAPFKLCPPTLWLVSLRPVRVLPNFAEDENQNGNQNEADSRPAKTFGTNNSR